MKSRSVSLIDYSDAREAADGEGQKEYYLMSRQGVHKELGRKDEKADWKN